MRFDDVKSDTLNLRVSPAFKIALRAAADHERRSMVNMLEVLLGDYCESKRINPTPVVEPAHRPAKRGHLKAATA